MNATHRNHLLNEDWVVTVTQDIDAMPDTVVDIVTPYTMGELDAFDGICNPTEYYAKLGDIEQYLWGWQDMNAAIEAEEYEESMLDIEDWRRGQW